MDSALSKPPWKTFIPITKFAYNLLPKILFVLTHLQETVAVRNKIENLLSRIAALEELFATHPGDVADLKRRDELIRYAAIPFLGSVLSSFQEARGH